MKQSFYRFSRAKKRGRFLSENGHAFLLERKEHSVRADICGTYRQADRKPVRRSIEEVHKENCSAAAKQFDEGGEKTHKKLIHNGVLSCFWGAVFDVFSIPANCEAGLCFPITNCEMFVNAG